jgi:hypothetical protein
MNIDNIKRLLIFSAAAGMLISSCWADEIKRREIDRTKEKALQVSLEVSFGSISIEHGEGDKIAEIEYEEEESDNEHVTISYEINDGLGELRIKMKESTLQWDDEDKNDDDRNIHRNHIDIKLGGSVPISFEIDLGAGKGDINLTDLQVKELKISTGASKVSLECDKPNPISANSISIESGVGKFMATNLANLNSKKLKFSGGIGSYELDFNGRLKQSADVKVEIGLGSIRIGVPSTIPARLVYDDHWFSSFNIDDDFSKKQENVYETEDFSEDAKHIVIQLEAGLGRVRVHRK